MVRWKRFMKNHKLGSRFGFANRKQPAQTRSSSPNPNRRASLACVCDSGDSRSGLRNDNRGQFMALYLPILTLFMCFLVATMYWVQNSALDNHMVSPVKVLDMKLDKEIFELAEKEWICLADKNSK